MKQIYISNVVLNGIIQLLEIWSRKITFTTSGNHRAFGTRKLEHKLLASLYVFFYKLLHQSDIMRNKAFVHNSLVQNYSMIWIWKFWSRKCKIKVGDENNMSSPVLNIFKCIRWYRAWNLFSHIQISGIVFETYSLQRAPTKPKKNKSILQW